MKTKQKHAMRKQARAEAEQKRTMRKQARAEAEQKHAMRKQARALRKQRDTESADELLASCGDKHAARRVAARHAARERDLLATSAEQARAQRIAQRDARAQRQAHERAVALDALRAALEQARRDAARKQLREQLRTAQRVLGAVSGALRLRKGALLAFCGKVAARISADGTAIAVLRGHEGEIKGARELGDGRLLTWASDKTLRLWAADGKALAVFIGHERPIRDCHSAEWRGKSALVSVSDTETIFWDATSQRAVAAFSNGAQQLGKAGALYALGKRGLAVYGKPLATALKEQRQAVLRRAAVARSRAQRAALAERAAALRERAALAERATALFEVRVGSSDACIALAPEGALLLSARGALCAERVQLSGAVWRAGERLVETQTHLVCVGVFDKEGGGWQPSLLAMPRQG